MEPSVVHPKNRARLILEHDGVVSLLLAGVEIGLRGAARWNVALTRRVRAMRFRVSMSREDRRILSRNRVLEGLHAERRCFVIGTGASLRHQDLSPLKNEITFAVNRFWQHPMLDDWSPSYYLFCDPGLFDGQPKREEFFEGLSRASASKFILPLFSRDIVLSKDMIPDDRIYWAAMYGDLTVDGLRDWPDLTKWIPGVQGVSHFAIMAAMFLGCSPIYLLGFDHDGTVRRSNFHFYDDPELGDQDPDYQTWSNERLFQDEVKLYAGYREIQRQVSRRNTSLVNLTDGGYLDVFPRANYESIVMNGENRP